MMNEVGGGANERNRQHDGVERDGDLIAHWFFNPS